MKDLEFLQKPNQPLKDVILVEKSNSLVFPEVIDRIKKSLLGGKCDTVKESSLEDLSSNLDNTLFDRNLYQVTCNSEEINSDLVKELEIHVGNNSILFLVETPFSANSELDAHSLTSTFIQATPYKKSKWDEILQNLLKIFYPIKAGVKNFLQLRACLQELKEEYEFDDLAFMKAFNFTLLAFVNLNSEGNIAFDWTAFKKHFVHESRESYYQIHKNLARYLISPSSASGVQFLAYVRELESFQSGGRSFTSSLYRAGFDLLSVNQALSLGKKEDNLSNKENILKAYWNLSPDIFLRFLSKLSEWEIILNSSNNLFLDFERFLNDYSFRVSSGQ